MPLSEHATVMCAGWLAVPRANRRTQVQHLIPRVGAAGVPALHYLFGKLSGKWTRLRLQDMV